MVGMYVGKDDEAWHMTNLELGRGSAGVDLDFVVFRDAIV